MDESQCFWVIEYDRHVYPCSVTKIEGAKPAQQSYATRFEAIDAGRREHSKRQKEEIARINRHASETYRRLCSGLFAHEVNW